MDEAGDSVLVISVAPFRLATRSRKAAEAYALDHRVRFVSLAAAGRTGRRDRAGRWRVDSVEVEQVPVARISTSPSRTSQLVNLFRAYLPAVARLTRLVLGDRSARVHVAEPTLAFLGVLHTLRNRSTFILDIPERPGMVRAKGSLASVFSRIQPGYLRSVSRWVDLATVVVPGDLERIRDFGFADVRLVRNVPFSTWRADYRDPPERGPGELRAAVVGSLFEGRGYEILLDALALARERGGQIRVLVCGPGRPDYVDTLRRRAEKVGVGPYVEWREAVPSEEVSQLYLECHVGLVLYEGRDPGNDGLSNKIMEAVATGRPVLAGALPENAAFVARYACGWISQMEVGALADALLRISQVPDLTELARHCRRLGDEELRWDVEFTAVLDVRDEAAP